MAKFRQECEAVKYCVLLGFVITWIVVNFDGMNEALKLNRDFVSVKLVNWTVGLSFLMLLGTMLRNHCACKWLDTFLRAARYYSDLCIQGLLLMCGWGIAAQLYMGRHDIPAVDEIPPDMGWKTSAICFYACLIIIMLRVLTKKVKAYRAKN